MTNKKPTTINILNFWLKELDQIQLSRKPKERKIRSWKPYYMGKTYYEPVEYQPALQGSLNAYKKKLNILEKKIIREFRFSKEMNKTFDDWFQKNGSIHLDNTKTIYMEGIMDIRIIKKGNEWKLKDFGFGWLEYVFPFTYVQRNNHEMYVESNTISGYDYISAIEKLENSKDVLKKSIIFLKDIISEKKFNMT